MKSAMEWVWHSVSLVIFTALGVAALSLAVKTTAEAFIVIRVAMS
ncbi:MAG: hypothetical protein Q27BB25_04495 [Blastomonas sp. CACIA14H2]|nr:MAG: hypothetical protein Q27BB25_04495 [Blastomonas sp. CACIA14H2]